MTREPKREKEDDNNGDEEDDETKIGEKKVELLRGDSCKTN